MDTRALDQAIAAFKTQDAFAAVLGVRSASISGWRKRGKVPAERCVAIEQATHGQVTRYQLRPDVFGAAPPAPVQEAG